MAVLETSAFQWKQCLTKEMQFSDLADAFIQSDLFESFCSALIKESLLSLCLQAFSALPLL